MSVVVVRERMYWAKMRNRAQVRCSSPAKKGVIGRDQQAMRLPRGSASAGINEGHANTYRLCGVSNECDFGWAAKKRRNVQTGIGQKRRTLFVLLAGCRSESVFRPKSKYYEHIPLGVAPVTWSTLAFGYLPVIGRGWISPHFPGATSLGSSYINPNYIDDFKHQTSISDHETYQDDTENLYFRRRE